MILYNREWLRRESGPWFAWYPVWTEDKKIVWLEKVELRRWVSFGHPSSGISYYRIPREEWT
jgi:hypothetical protein